MKTNKSRFTDDDIRRNLPPDVFHFLHDLAYLNPHRTSLRQSVISFINGARSLLRKESDGDIDAQLHARELFSIDRCIDRMCDECEAGEKVTRWTHGDINKPEVAFVHDAEGRRHRCPAEALHHYRERIATGLTQSITPKEGDSVVHNGRVLKDGIWRDAEGRN